MEGRKTFSEIFPFPSHKMICRAVSLHCYLKTSMFVYSPSGKVPSFLLHPGFLIMVELSYSLEPGTAVVRRNCLLLIGYKYLLVFQFNPLKPILAAFFTIR